MNNYKNALRSENNIDRPDFWGGYSFTPYLIEFWEGNISRVNKRLVYKKFRFLGELLFTTIKN